MCVSTPKVEKPAAPPKVETMETEANVAAGREAARRRQLLALSRQDTLGGGAMQGSQAAGKTKLGA